MGLDPLALRVDRANGEWQDCPGRASAAVVGARARRRGWRAGNTTVVHYHSAAVLNRACTAVHRAQA